MYLSAKFVDHRFYKDEDINAYINSNIDTLEKAELTAPICHIARFLKSGISIFNFEVPDTAAIEKERRRTETIAKRSAICVNAIKQVF